MPLIAGVTGRDWRLVLDAVSRCFSMCEAARVTTCTGSALEPVTYSGCPGISISIEMLISLHSLYY